MTADSKAHEHSPLAGAVGVASGYASSVGVTEYAESSSLQSPCRGVRGLAADVELPPPVYHICTVILYRIGPGS